MSGVYRVPSPEDCGLTEMDDGSLVVQSEYGDRILPWPWPPHDPSPGWLVEGLVNDPYEATQAPFATRGDALVAWCLATGRRHLVWVPPWEDLGGRLTDQGAAGDGWEWVLYRNSVRFAPGDAPVPAADEVEARFAVAVLQALKAGL